MGFETKLNLNNNKFQQLSGDTFTSSGATHVFGSLNILSGATFKLLDNAKEGNLLTIDSNGNVVSQEFTGITYNGITGATNGLTKIGSNVNLGGSLTDTVRLNINGNTLYLDKPYSQFGAFNSSVNDIFYNNGNYTIGGSFTGYSTTNAYYFANLDSNGSLDIGLNNNVSFNGAVNAIYSASGSYIVGGSFTEYSSTTYNYVIKLSSTGLVDGTFNVGTGFNGPVNSIVATSGGKYIIGGNFTTYNGSGCTNIARLNSDGSFDSTFLIGSGFNGVVNTLFIDSNEKIFVGGNFTTYSGASANSLIRLNSNGTIDTSFDIGVGFNDEVFAISETSNNIYVIGGSFTSYKGNNAYRIVSLNNDGSVYMNYGASTGFNNTVKAILVDESNDGIIVGGLFDQFDGVSSSKIRKISLSDGIIDNIFYLDSGLTITTVNKIIKAYTDYIVGGNFTYASNPTNIIKLDSFGTVNTSIENIINITNNTLAYNGDQSPYFNDWSLINKKYMTDYVAKVPVNTASNIGTGYGIFSEKCGVDLEFKSLVAGDGIVLSTGITSITICSTASGGGEANTASNLGTGYGLYACKSGADLEFKSLSGGTGIVLLSGATRVNICTTAEANTASNLGTGYGLYACKSGVDLRFKSLSAGTGISLTTGSTRITICSTSSGGHTIQENSVSKTSRACLNFNTANSACQVYDDAANNQTDICLKLKGLNDYDATGEAAGYVLSVNSAASGYTTQAVAPFTDILRSSEANISADGLLSTYLLAGYRFDTILIQEKSGNAAGNISLGSTSGGTDIISGSTITANADTIVNVITPYFSSVNDTNIYISSSSWGSGVVQLNFTVKRVI